MDRDSSTLDHAQLHDPAVARRYFGKFALITSHMKRVAAAMEAEGSLTKNEVTVLGRYVTALGRTFSALSNKFLLAGREGVLGPLLDFDRVDSGFPVFQEILTMANDAHQAERHLRNMPSASALKDQMVRAIVGDLQIPTKLQYALSQRLYYEELARGDLFWARNDPEAIWQGDLGPDRRTYLIHWALYDSQTNLPCVYVMEVEDSGRTALPRDQRRWPLAQSHLMAQSFTGLKLVTMAQGFDTDFDDLHPISLKRFHLGPMYSNAFTVQEGPISEVLAEAQAPQGQDWALAWTAEELRSERWEWEKSGWFGKVERQIYTLDPFGGQGAETGATSTERSIILPERPFQVLAEKNPPGFHKVRKFVVSPGGRVLSYR
ncbi:hypothetical protein IV417_18370 [Alphaproteobacteria bacterium KMM 3653]|uniref:Uncharacterized protein n=1 Tax=Harenicola maris TaxID=2841044 RepID=A0AAP2CTC5_9RHOB|nr:hypothetical protein [Harenicola maris]